jgi:hypothetical protein
MHRFSKACKIEQIQLPDLPYPVREIGCSEPFIKARGGRSQGKAPSLNRMQACQQTTSVFCDVRSTTALFTATAGSPRRYSISPAMAVGDGKTRGKRVYVGVL